MIESSDIPGAPLMSGTDLANRIRAAAGEEAAAFRARNGRRP
jgi:hypothetical protein